MTDCLTAPGAAASWLPLPRFAQVVADAPLVAVDLVVVQGSGANRQVLLGYRNNRPAKGFWFVPGGRIHKGEALQAALARTLQAELGLSQASLQQAGGKLAWLGVYQHFYADSFVDAGLPTHYVVLAHVLTWPQGEPLPLPLPDAEVAQTAQAAQHARWQWWPVEEALHSTEVHTHTRDYLAPGNAVWGASG